MENSDFFRLIPDAAAQMKKGAFLTEGKEPFNPMTIGWAQFGFVWGKPVVMVMVRKSRFSYPLMEKTDVFSVSVPAAGTMEKELGYCGSHSGRDGDKMAAAGLRRLPNWAGGADGIAGCKSHFECRIVCKQDGTLDTMDEAIKARFYGSNQALSNGDPHVLYFGEVLGAYEE